MKTTVLFLCTANAARSQMAEALLRQHAGDRFDVFSAGTEPGEVTPETLSILTDRGIDTTGLRAKSISQFADQHFDYVITLCDKAHRECQNWPGSDQVLAWDFPDPQLGDGANCYQRTFSEINERIRLFVLISQKPERTSTRPPSGLSTIAIAS